MQTSPAPPAAPADESARAPDLAAPPPGNPRFPLFDGLRAIAAISIVLTHTATASGYTSASRFGPWASTLAVGVAVFFVISGFLLYRPFVAAQMEGGSGPRPSRFLRRRLLRIVPAYWVALTVLSLTTGSPKTFDHVPKYYLFLQIYSLSLEGIGQAWSLCIEMSFYLLLPLYAFAILRTLGAYPPTHRLRLELVVLSVLSALSVWAHYSAAHGRGGPIVSALPQYMLWFAVGMSLALASAWSDHAGGRSAFTRLVRHPGWCWAIALALFVVCGELAGIPEHVIADGPDQSMIRWSFYAAISFFLVLPAVSTEKRAGLPGRVLAWRPVAWLGFVSYGIFLWHFGPMNAIYDHNWVTSTYAPTRFLEYSSITLAVTVVLAAISYYVVERPFLRLKEVSRRPRRAE